VTKFYKLVVQPISCVALRYFDRITEGTKLQQMWPRPWHQHVHVGISNTSIDEEILRNAKVIAKVNFSWWMDGQSDGWQTEPSLCIALSKNIILWTIYNPPPAMTHLYVSLELLQQTGVPVETDEGLGQHGCQGNGARRAGTQLLHHGVHLLPGDTYTIQSNMW